jgi:murein tripeptide amidase MpaA
MKLRSIMKCSFTASTFAVGLSSAILAQSPTPTLSPPADSAAASEPVLPPLIPWAGKSRALVLQKNDPWITPAEKSEFRLTPSYDDTVEWLRKLCAAASELKMISLGKSPEGREIWMVVASREKLFTPEALRKTGKVTVFAQAGIHSGEIDGKDAGLMLLRDMTVHGTKRDLLEHANFLFVPIFNVDGHERTSRFSRVNQRGPERSGWRTNSKNLNLNRDYTKVDTPEMEAMIQALNAWQPDLYLDLHVTDGADFQYDVTFGSNGEGGHSPAIASWMEKTFNPAVTKDLIGMGHIPGPVEVANWIDPLDLSKGIRVWMADPRFSNGYGDVRHLPTILIEDHSLKPYDQRVLGAYVFLESAIRVAGTNVTNLRQAIEADQKSRAKSVPLTWDEDSKRPSQTIDYKAIESRAVPSTISGGVRLEFTGKPVTTRIPFKQLNHPAISVPRPTAYWIPPAWNELANRLKTHGIQFERIDQPRDLAVTMYRLDEMKFQDDQPFEGHVQVNFKIATSQPKTEHYPPGSIRVPTDQPLGDLAIILLEPASPDSFLQWGFFNQIFQPTEYIEGYILEPMADRMLAADPQLAEQFKQRLASDEKFRASIKDRLRWFYERTPFVDQRWKLYPVGREEQD